MFPLVWLSVVTLTLILLILVCDIKRSVLKAYGVTSHDEEISKNAIGYDKWFERCSSHNLIVYTDHGKDWKTMLNAGIDKWTDKFNESFDTKSKKSYFTANNLKKMVKDFGLLADLDKTTRAGSGGLSSEDVGFVCHRMITLLCVAYAKGDFRYEDDSSDDELTDYENDDSSALKTTDYKQAHELSPTWVASCTDGFRHPLTPLIGLTKHLLPDWLSTSRNRILYWMAKINAACDKRTRKCSFSPKQFEKMYNEFEELAHPFSQSKNYYQLDNLNPRKEFGSKCRQMYRMLREFQTTTYKESIFRKMINNVWK